jgi:hypothetical protein
MLTYANVCEEENRRLKEQVLTSVCLIYWDKSANTDAARGALSCRNCWQSKRPSKWAVFEALSLLARRVRAEAAPAMYADGCGRMRTDANGCGRMLRFEFARKQHLHCTVAWV